MLGRVVSLFKFRNFREVVNFIFNALEFAIPFSSYETRFFPRLSKSNVSVPRSNQSVDKILRCIKILGTLGKRVFCQRLSVSCMSFVSPLLKASVFVSVAFS
jgi:hypothetical protein